MYVYASPWPFGWNDGIEAHPVMVVSCLNVTLAPGPKSAIQSLELSWVLSARSNAIAFPRGDQFGANCICVCGDRAVAADPSSFLRKICGSVDTAGSTL